MLSIIFFLWVHCVIGSMNNEAEYGEKQEIMDFKDGSVKENVNPFSSASNTVEDTNTSYHEVVTSEHSNTNIDNENTFKERLKLMPLKLGLQVLTAKHGFSDGLGQIKRGGGYIYNGTKNTIDTMVDLAGKGISDTKFLIFGTR